MGGFLIHAPAGLFIYSVRLSGVILDIMPPCVASVPVGFSACLALVPVGFGACVASAPAGFGACWLRCLGVTCDSW